MNSKVSGQRARRFDLDLPLTESAPWRARRAVDELGDRIDDQRFDDLRLLVSELVTNSVKYAQGFKGQIGLTICIRGDTIRAEVSDPGPEFRLPDGRLGPLDSPGGWGLTLVDRVSCRWGISQAGGGSHVWFELDNTRN